MRTLVAALAIIIFLTAAAAPTDHTVTFGVAASVGIEEPHVVLPIAVFSNNDTGIDDTYLISKHMHFDFMAGRKIPPWTSYTPGPPQANDVTQAQVDDVITKLRALGFPPTSLRSWIAQTSTSKVGVILVDLGKTYEVNGNLARLKQLKGPIGYEERAGFEYNCKAAEQRGARALETAAAEEARALALASGYQLKLRSLVQPPQISGLCPDWRRHTIWRTQWPAPPDFYGVPHAAAFSATATYAIGRAQQRVASHLPPGSRAYPVGGRTNATPDDLPPPFALNTQRFVEATGAVTVDVPPDAATMSMTYYGLTLSQAAQLLSRVKNLDIASKDSELRAYPGPTLSVSLTVRLSKPFYESAKRIDSALLVPYHETQPMLNLFTRTCAASDTAIDRAVAQSREKAGVLAVAMHAQRGDLIAARQATTDEGPNATCGVDPSAPLSQLTRKALQWAPFYESHAIVARFPAVIDAAWRVDHAPPATSTKSGDYTETVNGTNCAQAESDALAKIAAMISATATPRALHEKQLLVSYKDYDQQKDCTGVTEAVEAI